MNPSDLHDLAARFGIRPNRSLGQNFLADANLARAIVADARVGPGDDVLEVGAGFGSLTIPLAAAGAHVLAIEFDRGLVPALREATAALPATAGEVDVREADVTKLDWVETLGEHRWVMVSNLPYNIATPLVLDMLEARLPIDRYVIMLQAEVGERVVAGPGEPGYGAPSVRVAYHAAARILRRIPPGVFWPEPAIASVIVELVPHAPTVEGDEAAIFRVVQGGFAQRRKTIRATLRRIADLDTPAAESVLRDAGVDSQARPGTLSLEEFASIAAHLPGGAP